MEGWEKQVQRGTQVSRAPAWPLAQKEGVGWEAKAKP